MKQQQKHLVLGRNFEDILEACRPRNKGSYAGGTPPALISQLKMFELVGERKLYEGSSVVDRPISDNPQEWNSIHLRDPSSSPIESLNGSIDLSGRLKKHDSSSDLSNISSSPSSIFASNLSMILGRSPGHIHHGSPSLKHIQIQQNASSDLPLDILNNDTVGAIRRSNSQGTIDSIDDPQYRKASRSDSIISSCYSTGSVSQMNGKLSTLGAIKKAMDLFDEYVFRNDVDIMYVEGTPRHEPNKVL
jgi:hypothetical protein